MSANQRVHPLAGQVTFASRSTMATMTDVAVAATVSLIDTGTNTTVATTVTNSSGQFNLTFPSNFTPDPAVLYYLEAVKGLSSNMPGNEVARVRTIAKYSSAGWTTITNTTPNTGIVINRSSTALSIGAALRNGHPSAFDFSSLIGKIAVGTTDTYTPVAGLSSGDYTELVAMVTASLTANQDPVGGVSLDVASSTWKAVLKAPALLPSVHMAPDDAGDPLTHHDYVMTKGGVSSTFVWIPVLKAYQLIVPASCGASNSAFPVGYWVKTQPSAGTENTDWASETFGGFYAGKYEASHVDGVQGAAGTGAGATEGTSATLKVQARCVPWNTVTWDQAAQACLAYDAHCHMMRDDDWTALAVWSTINNVSVQGNNNGGKDIDVAATTFIEDPTYTVGTLDRALTGSATNSAWTGNANLATHTGTTAGVYDLHGNVQEWTETIGSAITSGNYILNDIDSGTAAPAQNYVSQLSTDARFRRYSLPGATSATVSTYFGGDNFWKTTSSNMKSLRGGNWIVGGGSGVWALNLSAARSHVGAGVGFRPVLRF